jgi:hypothetical protein
MNRQQATPSFVFLYVLSCISNAASYCQVPLTAEKAAGFSVPRVELPLLEKHPMVACTPEELGRLKAAYAGRGKEQELVARVIVAAGGQLARPIIFPPRGGQHNQWYQCDKCQIGLITHDATHHECPRCKTVYSGEPYDDVLFARVHIRNLRAMADAAWAYAITGEEKYASLAAQVLVGYASLYKKYLYHDSGAQTGMKAAKSGGHLFEQTLNEASALTEEIAPAYDLIHGSKSLSAEDHRVIREGLLRPMLENIAKHKAGKSNWQTWHNSAMLWGGAVLGDVSWVKTAIEDPANGFLFQMQASVSDDGMWYENSWGYHFYTLSAMVKSLEGSRRLGIDLWRHPVLKRMFTVPVDYAMPDGSLPRFGDDVHTSVSQASRMLEFAYHTYRDPAMLPFLPRQPSWESVMFGRVLTPPPRPGPQASKLFPSAGHAILRTEGEKGLAAAFTFGPYGGFHGHLDKLSFVLFGYGRELGVDPGRAKSQAYRLPIHSHWYKATLGHNAVLVDGQPQKPATGKLESFTTNGTYSAVVARCDEAYPGIRYRRLLCLTPGYLLVFDDLLAKTPRRFDWVYHNRGPKALCDTVGSQGPINEPTPGWEYVKNVRYGMTDGPVRVRFPDGFVTTYLLIAPESGTEVRTGDGVGESLLDRVGLVLVTRHSRQAQFAAVLEPVTGREPNIVSIRAEPAQDGQKVTVRRGDTADKITISSSGEVTVSVQGQTVLTGKR